ncbi:hypothetical protein ONE63_008152 [Megalurothrips usitatus]|uniref:CHK kinase-like domain-containing protein n=1 Tax=Megalurothrips usitatus TaxID=439358 RepID=A0AAV7XPG9_9NEOP|nr:hypothetical protein ONE63_008152 [Megalurothrips usitatus]
MCKTMPNKAAAGSFKDLIFLAEGFMYQTVLPAFAEVAKLEAPLPWPRCLRAAVAGPSPPLLVLGDLRPEGFRMVNRREPLDHHHCRLALTQLARFHGASMALKHRKPDVLKVIHDRLGGPEENVQMKELFTHFFAAAKSAPGMYAPCGIWNFNGSSGAGGGGGAKASPPLKKKLKSGPLGPGPFGARTAGPSAVDAVDTIWPRRVLLLR